MADIFPILVTGANGQLGRLVIKALLDDLQVPAAQIIATSRSVESLTDLAALGVVTRTADFDDPSSLQAAFSGARRLLLISTDAIDRAGGRLQQHKNAVAAAEAAGVSHVVYTSMPKPEPGSAITFAGDHYGTEQALAASNLSWTVLRNCWYMENLLMSVPHALQTGQWYSAAADGKVANISRADCALAAATALAKADFSNKTYTLTGAEAHSTAEMAAIISEVTGKPLQVIDIPDAALAEGLQAAGLPGFLIPVLVSFDTNTRLGGVADINHDFTTLTGRQPLPFRDFVVASKAALLGT
ncbi:nucleoside-diphosphate sugar epimerase [Pokkaliibacter plantistimulans]|uniref:Nucleoside-diphosphate sugar epimerase n=1 Tax=Pokkaliibacter plantistimulans TaxID=1635171 RepID=A0ABX5LTX5_9GAMM|nr:SDR family oxidoreductase [Pokkaliibacter plantistimulans]PXF28731.1 nucleoside-diphosphate sugar epimerase [Pokkaliibacter plantistimulans]